MQRDYTEYLVTATGGINWVTITNPNTRLVIIPGWEINLAGFMYKILDWDPSNYTLYLNGVVAAGNYTSVIHNTGLVLGLNTRDGYVRERIQLKIDNGTNVTTTSNSAQVQIGGGASFMSMIAPGNLLKIIAGGNIVNCGWGPGIYPIAKVVDNTTLELTRTLSVTETKAFSILKNYT
jgi:hypothetical protein